MADDEWHSEIRHLTETQHHTTTQTIRVTAGLSAADVGMTLAEAEADRYDRY